MIPPTQTEPRPNRPPAPARGDAPAAADSGYILVVDDEPEIRRLVQEVLEDEHYAVVTAENAAAARAAFRQRAPDLVLLDIWMPDTDGISLLKEWSQAGQLPAPVVMMSGHGTVETAVEATRLGAYDFIEKPVSLGKLLVTVKRALEAAKLKRENLSLSHQAEPNTLLVGKSAVMRDLKESLERIAHTDSWVLITGEPGSGKAVAARYLHAHSARRERPCVEISLAAIPAPSLAAQLFGRETEGGLIPGSFEQASGGTLVLNEIGDLDNATQTKLFNTLAEGRFLRVDGRAPVPLAARIIAVCSQDLARAVVEKRFREDLYYRLNVVPLPMPPLREHREDVPELVNFYLNWLVDHEHLPYRTFTTGALNALRNYTWPGNIRELKNLVQRLLILQRGEEISETEIEQALGPARAAAPVAPGAPAFFDLPLRTAREQFEKEYLEYHLTRTGGNVAEVAKLSEMERTHLYRKLKQLGIQPKSLKE
jgi:DNA-binding NtrC family response regulator